MKNQMELVGLHGLGEVELSQDEKIQYANNTNILNQPNPNDSGYNWTPVIVGGCLVVLLFVILSSK